MVPRLRILAVLAAAFFSFGNVHAGIDADIAVTKTDGVTSAAPGQSVTYIIVVTNNGPDPNNSVSVTDTFPAVLTCNWTSAVTGGATGNSSSSGNLSDTLNMPVSSTVTYTVTCSIDPGATGTLSNTVTVTGAFDFDLSNNSATDNDTVLTPQADIAVTKTDGVTTAVPGLSLIYTIMVSNNGPSDDPSVAVGDGFPAVLTCTYTSVAAGGATGNTAAGAGNLSDTLSMPASSTVTYTVTCNIDSGATGTLSNTVIINGSVTDLVPGNDSATDNNTLLTPQADIAVTKTDGVTTAIPGLSLTYTIMVSNNGPSDDPSVSMTDTFPVALTCSWTSVAAGGATGNSSSSGNISDTLNMPVGSSVTYTVPCNINPSVVGTLSNTATGTASATDLTPGNNSATDNDTLTPQAELSLTKIAVNIAVHAELGDVFDYEIEVFNDTPSDATNVVVTDTLPPELAFVDSDCGMVEGPPGVLTWNVGTLGPGAAATCTLTVEIVNFSDLLINAASVDSDVTDTNEGNNTTSSRDDGAIPTIPTLGLLGLLLLMLGLAGVGAWRLRRA